MSPTEAKERAAIATKSRQHGAESRLSLRRQSDRPIKVEADIRSGAGAKFILRRRRQHPSHVDRSREQHQCLDTPSSENG